MPAASRMSETDGASFIPSAVSRIVMFAQPPNYHRLCGDVGITVCDTSGMSDESKNAGPNHLKAWREFRGLTQQQLADAAHTTQHQIAYLESGERSMSAKWLRRLAPALDTTPGMLLDHDPSAMSADIVDIWATASLRQKQQLVEVARAIVKTGTDD